MGESGQFARKPLVTPMQSAQSPSSGACPLRAPRQMRGKQGRNSLFLFLLLRRLGVVLPSTSRSHRDYIKEKAQQHDPRPARRKNNTPWAPTRMPTPFPPTTRRPRPPAKTVKRRDTPRSSPRQAADRSKESAAILRASIRTFSTIRRLGGAVGDLTARPAAMVRREMPPALDGHAVAGGANAIGRRPFCPSVAAAGNAAVACVAMAHSNRTISACDPILHS